MPTRRPMIRRGRCWRTRLLATVAVAAAIHAVPALSAESTVHFETGCDGALARRFDHAVTMLHSFEYPESERLFRAILADAPDCGMARWGVAMSLWHQIWVPPDQQTLAAGQALLAGIDHSRLSAREAGYVDALNGFYADHQHTPHGERAQRYRERMHELHLDHLNDPEAALFYALALLATAAPTDKSYQHQYAAAAVLNWVLNAQPRHPGALHYLIHSYDYPGLAHLALPAALSYATAAPDSAHAQHMPSHIFTRLGMWRRAIGSNEDSTASAAAYTEHARLPGHYDEGLHSIDYLMYALLQVTDDAAAGRLLERLHGIRHAYPQTFKVAYTYAASPARYALERRQWQEAAALPLLPGDFPWDEFPWALSIHHFARGIGAARSGRIADAHRELTAIEAIVAQLPDDTLAYWREEAAVQRDALAAWIALADGDGAGALALAAGAADREDAVDKHPVTPGEVVPARELFADLALELQQPELALAQYQRVLRASPNRTNALLGAARAAAAAGDRTAAAGYSRQLLEQTEGGNASRTGLAEARGFDF